MKSAARVVTVWFALWLGQSVIAAEADLPGTWQGTLQVDPKTTLTLRFTFSAEADGRYAAVLNSSDGETIKNVAADRVSFSNGALALEVKALSGSYNGAARGGKIEGTWNQPGASLPLVLSPYQKPTMSEAELNTLLGTWSGPLKTPTGTITLINRYRLDDKGQLQGAMSVPEAGGNEVPFADIAYADGRVSYRVPSIEGQYVGTIAHGIYLGRFKQQGAPPEGLQVVLLKKGEAAPPVYTLAGSFATLSGKWEGTLELSVPSRPKAAFPVALRFMTDQQGRRIGYLDSPKQNLTGIPLTDVSLNGDKFAARTATGGIEIKGALLGKTLTASMTHGPINSPLVLTKK